MQQATKTSPSARMRRSKALVFGDEDDEDVRQEQGPHARSTDANSSDDDESSDTDERTSPAHMAVHSALSDAYAVSSDSDVYASAASPASATTTTAAALAVAGANTAENADTVVATDSSANKRRRGADAVDAHDKDVQPLQLRKVHRAKAPAVASKRARTEASPSFASPSSMLSPMKDDSKKKRTPRKTRVPKKPQSLHTRMGEAELTKEQVVTMIAELFEEQEQDDRDMYNILTQTVKEQTQCERSDVVEELSQMEFRRMLTYGEVSVESVSSTILPFLQLRADDVFYDLGCGSGKILIQAVLQTPCTIAKGIELMQNRVQQGTDALERLLAKQLPVMTDKSVDIVQGDICKPPVRAPMVDATVVFINNVCFGPELMLRVTQMLTKMPKLRRVVTLRKFCVRHRPQKCMRAGSHCIEYVHPPSSAEISVSWASKTSVYLYERVDFSLAMLAAQMQTRSHEAGA